MADAYDVFYDPPRQSFVSYVQDVGLTGRTGACIRLYAMGRIGKQGLHPLVKTATDPHTRRRRPALGGFRHHAGFLL